ncbi:MAG: hypothetical protein IPI49_32065 [Myxococcales bacterium]|nr:hypothetical protein [Myxococcales bacterium]
MPGLGEQGRDLEIGVSYTYSKVRNGVKWLDLRRNLASLPNNTPVGVLPDGRPLYDTVGATPGDLFNPTRGYDMLLTNTGEGSSHAASLSLKKEFPFGLTLLGSYAFTRAQEVSPANSTRSVTNYSQGAVVDPRNPEVATSNYEREHRIIHRPVLAHAHRDLWPCCEQPWKGMRTTLSLVHRNPRSGQPYSFTFADQHPRRHLARIFGEGASSPAATGSSSTCRAATAATSRWVAASTRPPSTTSSRSAASTSIAARSRRATPPQLVAQPLRSAHLARPARARWRATARASWSTSRTWATCSTTTGAATRRSGSRSWCRRWTWARPATGKYLYGNLRTLKPQRVDVLASVWRMGLGLLYDF